MSDASYIYGHAPGNLFDVTSGSNGGPHCTTYLCNAGSGYDGPTGLGTPIGTSAFLLRDRCWSRSAPRPSLSPRR